MLIRESVFVVVISVCIALTGCITPNVDESLETLVEIDLANPLVQKAYESFSENDTDKMLQFFKSGDESAHLVAMKHFTKIKDAKVVPYLTYHIDSSAVNFKLAAMSALANNGDSSNVALLLEVYQRDTFEFPLKAKVLETIGAIGNQKQLEQVATIGSFQFGDTVLIEGQSAAINNFLARGFRSEVADKRQLVILQKAHSIEAKILASEYFLNQPKSTFVKENENLLILAFTAEEEELVKVQLAKILGGLRTTTALAVLKAELRKPLNPITKGQLLKVLSSDQYSEVSDVMFEYATDTLGHNLSYLTAEFFLEKGASTDALKYLQLGEAHIDTMAKAAFFAAAFNKSLSNPGVRQYTGQALNFAYNKTVHPVYKSAYIKAMSEYLFNVPLIYNKMKIGKTQLERTVAFEELASKLSPQKGFNINQFPNTRNNLIYYMREAIQTGDVAQISLAEPAFKRKDIPYAIMYAHNFYFFNNAKKQAYLKNEQKGLRLIDSLSKGFTYKLDTTQVYTAKSPSVNVIDWSKLNAYGSTVSFVTNKGNVEFELDFKNTPSTSSKFIKNALAQLYDSTYFYDGSYTDYLESGCTRGDGYSYDMSPLPIENMSASTGVIVLAMHNDDYGTGRYVIQQSLSELPEGVNVFGRLVAGYEVLQQLRVGDEVKQVIIEQNRAQ